MTGASATATLEERPSDVELSVVVPLYNEEDNVPQLHQQLMSALEPMGRKWEIIYVDDGSRDESFARLRAVVAQESRARIIRFRRNYGQTAALQAGIDYSRGAVLVFMDADLQNDPADIPHLLARIDDGYDVVSGWRKNRHDPLLTRRIPSMLANWLISKVTGVHLNDYGCTLKAYRRGVVENERLYGEMHRFIPAYAAASGAIITELAVNHRPRTHGRSKYGLSRTFRVILDLLTVKFLGTFATKPLYVFGSIGALLWLGAIGAAIEVIVEKLGPLHTYAHSNPMLLLSVFCGILGMQFVMMGLLAEVLTRTYHESQDKPTFVVREIFSGAPNSETLGIDRPA